jgi:threonine aldolase
MANLGRRDMLKLGGMLAASGFPVAQAASPHAPDAILKAFEPVQPIVNFIYDGLHLTPQAYAHILQQYAESGALHPDNYSNGGVIRELEQTFARLLGKESAVFMPTGTLANHIAMRELAGAQRRVIVQAESHIYNDCGDCAQTLSGLNLIPLAPHRVGFTLEAIQDVLHTMRSGRVETQVGVISIETPVRRQHDAMFGYDEIRRIAHTARQLGIRLHLDGARLFVEAVHTGISPAQYAALFDTVYVSLYKCFNAASGAILAGTQAFTENLYHVRRMFGGGMPQVWPCAAVALHFADGFIDDYRAAWQRAEEVLQRLDAHAGFQVEFIPNGTHIVKLHVDTSDLDAFRDKLYQRHIHLPPATPGQQVLALKVNPSLNYLEPQDMAQAFIAAL